MRTRCNRHDTHLTSVCGLPIHHLGPCYLVLSDLGKKVQPVLEGHCYHCGQEQGRIKSDNGECVTCRSMDLV